MSTPMAGPIGNKTTKMKKIVMRPNDCETKKKQHQLENKQQSSNAWRNVCFTLLFTLSPAPSFATLQMCSCVWQCKQINSAANCKQSKSQMLRWELKQAYSGTQIEMEIEREIERERERDTQMSTYTHTHTITHIRIVGSNAALASHHTQQKLPQFREPLFDLFTFLAYLCQHVTHPIRNLFIPILESALAGYLTVLIAFVCGQFFKFIVKIKIKISSFS